MRDLAQIQVNDKLAYSIIKRVATRIGAAVINIIHIIGPQAVFIGGKMAVLGDALIQPIKEIVSKYLFGDQKVEVRLSEISEDTVAIGEAIYATTKYLEERSIEHIPIRRGVINESLKFRVIFSG